MRLKTAMVITVFVAALYSAPLVKAQKICYQVLIDDGSLDDTDEYLFESLQEVAKNYKLHVGQNLDTTQVFVDTDIYFQYRTRRKIYYCEKVKMVIDKKGNKKYKRIKKKELYAQNSNELQAKNILSGY
jgi:hypothetical protein